MSHHKNYLDQAFFWGLDGLRFLSITAVIWHHSAAGLTDVRFLKLGFLGVDLFFVISGFLIVTLLLRERDKTGGISLKSFYIRRSLRIFPLYYGFITLLALAYFFLSPDSEFGNRLISQLPIYFLYLANFVPVGLGLVWSLSSEEQFYLIWPFLEKYFRKYILHLLVGFLLINQFINFQRKAIAEWFDMPVLNELSIMQTTFTPILLGVALAHILHNPSGYKAISRFIRSEYSTVFYLVALVVVCCFAPADISGFTRLLIQILMFMLVASVVANEKNSLRSILSFKPFVRIGAISYGIYLFHIYAIVVCEKLLSKLGVSHDLLVFLGGYALVIVVAELSYRFYETPFLRLKKRFS